MNIDAVISVLSLLAAIASACPFVLHKSIPLTADMTNLDRVTKPGMMAKAGALLSVLVAVLAFANLVARW